MGARRSSVGEGSGRRLQTGRFRRLSRSALSGAKTLESVALPGLFVGAFVTLIFIQIMHAL